MPNVDAFLAARKAPASPRRDNHPHLHQRQHQHQRQRGASPSPHPHASALALASPLPTPARAREPPGWSSHTITTTRALARQATPPRRPPPAQLSPISCGHQRCPGNQHLPPEEAPSPHSPNGAYAPSPWGGAGAGQHGSSSDPWHVPRKRRLGASLEKEAREARHSPFVAGGRGSQQGHQQHQPRWRSPHGMTAGGSPFPLEGQVVTRGRECTPTSPPPVALLGAAAAYGSEDEEQRLAEQLQRARQRMQRHIKLQEWLIRKEQVELEAMEREEAGRRLAEQARREADLRFREHARRQKKKLEAYYAGLAAGTVPGEEAGAPGPSPPPILDLRPRKALP